MKLTEIASKINKYLKRFEADPAINSKHKGTSRYYWAQAVASGPRVFVCYIAYQGLSSLKKAEAEKYLAWLDAGNVGKHWQVKEPPPKP